MLFRSSVGKEKENMVAKIVCSLLLFFLFPFFSICNFVYGFLKTVLSGPNSCFYYFFHRLEFIRCDQSCDCDVVHISYPPPPPSQLTQLKEKTRNISIVVFATSLLSALLFQLLKVEMHILKPPTQKACLVRFKKQLFVKSCILSL